MATYKYTVEGIYETDKGASKDFTPFNYTIELPRFEGHEKGACTHILRRFLPMLIRSQKNKPLFSGIKSWVITNTEKVNDEFPLENKIISELDEKEIQQLACMYDLFEIPLPNTVSISELREEAQKAYIRHVLEVPMETIEEQMKCEFFVAQSDGTLKFDLQGKTLKVEIFNKDKKEVNVEKKSLDYYLQKARQSSGNGIVSVKANVDDGENPQEKKGDDAGSDDNKFPSFENLIV